MDSEEFAANDLKMEVLENETNDDSVITDEEVRRKSSIEQSQSEFTERKPSGASVSSGIYSTQSSPTVRHQCDTCNYRQEFFN